MNTKDDRAGSEKEKSQTCTRRSILKSGAALACSAIFPASLANAFARPNASANPSSPSGGKNPRWYGFNLLEYFSTDADWMKYFPYKNDGMFQEDDFRWIRDWGFTWVRLPMDYRFWTAPDLVTIDEKKVEPIDRAIRLGEKYGIHVNLCLHRAPGLCILDTMDEKLTGIRVTKEKTDVYTDPHTFDAFVHQWTYFASRYQGIPSKQLSFNLVNEPIVLPSSREMAELQKHGSVKTSDLFNPERMKLHETDYVRLAKVSAMPFVNAIPSVSSSAMATLGGGTALPELVGTGMMQSCHTYTPMLLTHHKCEWVMGVLTGQEPVPTWPLKDEAGKVICDRKTLENLFQPWASVEHRTFPSTLAKWGATNTLRLRLYSHGSTTLWTSSAI